MIVAALAIAVICLVLLLLQNRRLQRLDELEKQLIGGTLEIKDVPAAWNKLYKEYLGVDVPNDTMGCLQDTHWAGGMIGYFPSYALGSAYGAQMIAKMQEELGDIYADVANGDLSKVTAWLKEKIHCHASFKKPGDTASAEAEHEMKLSATSTIEVAAEMDCPGHAPV